MNTKSEQLYERACKRMPGGVNSPVRSFRSVGKTPFFVEKAAGAFLIDVDHNRYLDYVCSWGPGILGHAHPAVIEAVRRACEKGLTYGAPTEKEVELAELVNECVPSMEMMRLVSSGTEACMSAIRAARGFTGRDKIIKFEGCYHGHSDGLLVKAGSGLMTEAIPDSAGVPVGYAENTLLAVYNDPDSVSRLFDAYRNQIACVIVEPVAANMGVVPPAEGFLPFLREITEKNGALLIFDEVITGFRLSLGGAQEYYNIRPDLSTNPVAVTAGLETLRQLIAHPEIYEEIDRKAGKLEEAFREKGLTVNRAGSLLSCFFTKKPVTDYRSALRSDTKAFAAYFANMLERGIYVAPSQFEAMFVSAAHSDEMIERTCRAIRESV